MPIKVLELDDGLGNIIIGEGYLTGDEFLTAITEHTSKPDEQMRKYIYSICDYTKVTNTNISLKVLFKVALQMKKVSKINPSAIIAIAANTTTIYSLARSWSFLVSVKGWKIRVFRNRAELNIWLNDDLNKNHSNVKFELDKNL